MADIDDAIAAEQKRGTWSRRTIHDYAQNLRRIHSVCGNARLVPSRAGCGNLAPRIKRDEDVPRGLRRDDVLRLLASVRESGQSTSGTARF